ncbi:unnamed protein product [Rotaria socialis]|uniref:Uncharacterized protein n=1 Tax=Rotaria socialis TaxID=392032 RepID=A0A821PIL3_9BILA|nr:unnamed protein product [Rotaria socialis]
MEKCLNECYGSKNQTLAGDSDHENRTPREIIQHSCLLDTSIRTPDVQICKETTTCADSSGQFHLRDLVNVSSNKVGVVVRIEKEYLQLLKIQMEKNVLLTGGQSKFSSSLLFNHPAPFDRGRSNSTEETQQPFSTLNNTNLIGETVRISHGSYKGYIGNVKDSALSTRKVEPHAKRQRITVNRNRIVSIKVHSDDFSSFSAFNRTTLAYSHLVDTLSSDIESSRTRNSRSLYGFINHSSNIDSTISTYAM